MYCRFCGNPLTIKSQRYCMRCGAPTAPPAPKHSAEAFIISLLRCVCYFLLYYIIKFVVSSLYMFLVVGQVSLSGLPIQGSGYEGYSHEFWQVYSQGNCYAELAAAGIIILALFTWFTARHKSWTAEIGLHRAEPSFACASFLFGGALEFVSVFFISIMTSVFTVINQSGNRIDEVYDSVYGESPTVVMIILIAVVTPFIEEIIFRGLIYSRMKKGMPKTAAVILSAVAFGAAHMNLMQFLYAAAMGVILALLFEKSGSLWPCVLLHMGFNGASFFFDYVTDETGILYLCLFIMSCGAALFFLAYFFASKPAYKTPLKEKNQNEII